MELYAAVFDEDGNLAVNEDGTLATRPLTPDEAADLAAAMCAPMYCDYCSAPLAQGCADVACESCRAKVDAALAEADHAAWGAERDEADAALDAAQAADPVQRELDDYAADLRYEYSGPEYYDC